MSQEIKIANWDIIETPSKDVVIIIPPIPRPKGIIISDRGVSLITQGLPVFLQKSASVINVVKTARTVVVSECHEYIVRETWIRSISVENAPSGESKNDLKAA